MNPSINSFNKSNTKTHPWGGIKDRLCVACTVIHYNTLEDHYSLSQ